MLPAMRERIASFFDDNFTKRVLSQKLFYGCNFSTETLPNFLPHNTTNTPQIINIPLPEESKRQTVQLFATQFLKEKN